MPYEDFILTIRGTPGAYKVDARAGYGIQELDHPCDFAALDTLAADLADIQAGYAPGANAMQAMGAALYQGVFVPPIAAAFQSAMVQAKGQNHDLRVRLEIVASALAAYPWELLYDPATQSYLASRLTVPLVRGLGTGTLPVASLQTQDKVRILRVVASPNDLVTLNTGGDWLSPLWQGRGEVTTLHAATPQQLQDALRQKYHILHFDGHGGWDAHTERGYIVLQDANGAAWNLDSDTLFTYLDGSSVRLVVLAACDTAADPTAKRLAGVAQTLIGKGTLPAVMAMQYNIPDTAALTFAQTFYKAVADNYPVDAAVVEGRKALLTERGTDDPAWATPVLYLRAATGDLFAAPRRVPWQGDDLPANYVPRAGVLQWVRDLLIDPATGQGISATVGIYGAGGYGKSITARALCHDAAVRAAFPDGILWVTLGQSPDNSVGKVLDMVESLGGERGNFTTLEPATQRLAEVLGNRRCLIVLDDVWKLQDTVPFFKGGAACARLLTGRNVSAFPPQAHLFAVDRMTKDEALTLIGKGFAAADLAPLETTLNAIVALVGGWPLLLALINGVLQNRVRRQNAPFAKAVTYLQTALHKKGLAGVGKGERLQLQSTLDISLSQFSKEEQSRLTELGIFAEDVAIPFSVVYRWWNATGGLDEFDCDDLLDRLVDASLIANLDRSKNTLLLHDEIRLYLRDTAGDTALALLHGQWLDSFGVGSWRDHATVEPYLWQWLGYHLHAANRAEALYTLIADADFRTGQIAALGDVRATLNDTKLALTLAVAHHAVAEVLWLCRTYRMLAEQERVSDDIMGAIDTGNLAGATQLATYYGTPPAVGEPPHPRSEWAAMLYFYLAWEWALTGDATQTEKMIEAGRFLMTVGLRSVEPFALTLLHRIAAVLGQSGAAGLDVVGWQVRWQLPPDDYIPPGYSADGAFDQVQRAIEHVEEFRRRLMVGEGEAVSSIPFAKEADTHEMTGGLAMMLLEIADQPDSWRVIGDAIDAVLTNQYVLYRDIALCAVGRAALRVQDDGVVREWLRRILHVTLNSKGVTFEWNVPSVLAAIAMQRHMAIPDQLGYTLMAATNTEDKWGTALRAQGAYWVAQHAIGDLNAPLQYIALSQAYAVRAPETHGEPQTPYAGYAVLHALATVCHLVEFNTTQEIAWFFNNARAKAGFMQDPYWQMMRYQLANAAEKFMGFYPTPTVDDLAAFAEGMTTDEEYQFVVDYATARWVAMQPPQLEPLEQLLPSLLDGNPTLLDTVLARWLAAIHTTLPDNVIAEALLQEADRLRVAPPPASAVDVGEE